MVVNFFFVAIKIKTYSQKTMNSLFEINFQNLISKSKKLAKTGDQNERKSFFPNLYPMIKGSISYFSFGRVVVIFIKTNNLKWHASQPASQQPANQPASQPASQLASQPARPSQRKKNSSPPAKILKNQNF